MDESVIFVKELRSRDSDVCVLEDEGRRQTNIKPRRQKKPRTSEPIQFVDLSEESGNFEENNKNIDSRNNEELPRSVENVASNESSPENLKYRFECPVCLNPLQDLQMSITHCGHLYCKTCLDVIISKPRPKCPKCRKVIIKKHIRPVYV